MVRLMKAAIVAVAIAIAAPVQAQDYPNKPITLIHGFGAGGNADTMARILGDAMSKGLGQRVLVEAKPGASGVLASEILTRATPDGYTLLMLTAAHATTANMSKSLKYDPVEDFAMLTSPDDHCPRNPRLGPVELPLTDPGSRRIVRPIVSAKYW